MANLFADGFESGNWNTWSGNWSPDGDMSVTEAAALHGSYGLNCLINDTSGRFVRDDTPNAETRYRVRFYIDPNSLVMDDTENIIILGPKNAADSRTFNVYLWYDSGYKIRVLDTADGAWNKDSGLLAITDAPHCVEIDWKASTGAGNNDGWFTVWIDGSQVSNITAIDSDTESISKVEFGSTYVPVAITGTFYLDDFASNNDGSEIGLFKDFVYAGVATGGEFTFSGSATTEVGFGYVTSGSLAFSGTATIVHSKDYLISGSGSLAFSGSAVIIVGLTYVAQTGKWSGLGMVLFYTEESYIDTLLANGFEELRFDIPGYTDTTWVTNSKATVIVAVGKGVKVIWGVANPGAMDSEDWDAFRLAVLDAAQWAQDNGVYEFQLGNEEEFNTTMVLATLIANLKSLATEVQEIFTNGNVSYSCFHDNIDDWVSAGKGDIDILASNVYTEWGEHNAIAWEDEIDALIDAFGVDGTYLTEFSPNTEGLDMYSTDEAVQAAKITEMLNYIKASGMTRGHYFAWKTHSVYGGGSLFGVVKDDESYRQLWEDSLLDSAGASFRFSGSATQSYTYNFNTVAEGSLAFSGSATQIHSKNYLTVGDGSLTYSGEAVQEHSRDYVYTTDGTLTFSGVGVYVFSLHYIGSGSFNFSGIALAEKAYHYCIGTGSFNFSGEAVCYKELGYNGTGTFAFSGIATQSYTWNYSCVSFGNFTYSGIASYSFGISYNGTGGFNYSGSAECEYTIVAEFEYVGSGSFIYSGTAIQVHARYYLYSGSGEFIYSGSAVYPRHEIFTYTGSGILIYSGVAYIVTRYNWTKVSKEKDDWTKVDKEKEDWIKVEK